MENNIKKLNQSILIVAEEKLGNSGTGPTMALHHKAELCDRSASDMRPRTLRFFITESLIEKYFHFVGSARLNVSV